MVYYNFLKSVKKNKLGFSLLELLVVIGIIALLVGMGAVSYSTAQRKARDSKRKQDVQAIQNAFEQYYSVCNYQYPTAFGSSVVCASITPTVMIMPTIPVDPKTALTYSLVTSGSGDSYQVCANTMEAESPTGYCVNNRQ